jgi:hypothetical protein
MPTPVYSEHAREALQVIEHTLHHLDLKRFDASWSQRDLERFERNLDWFKRTYRHDREKADEAWDLLIGPLLTLIEAAGDGSDELEQHRDDLIALSEDYLGTHHNRDGFTGIDDREDNPSKAILNRRRAILHDVLRKALELAPPSIDREFVRVALGPIIEQIVNPPKPAKQPKAKVEKPLKDGQLGNVVAVKVLTGSEGFKGDELFAQLSGSEWQKHDGINSILVPAKPFGFSGSDRQVVVVDLSGLPQRTDSTHKLQAFDLVSGIPIAQDDTAKELVKRLRSRWEGGTSPIDQDELLASIGTVEDIIARGWDASKTLWEQNAFEQRSEKADRRLLEAFIELQNLQLRRGLSGGLPAVHMDTDLETGFKFLTEYSLEVATANRDFTDADLAANRLFFTARNLYGEAAASKQIAHHAFFTQTKFVDKLQEAIERVEDWGDDPLQFFYTTAFDAWKAEKDAEELARQLRRMDDLARREAYEAAEAARLAKPEEAAFDGLFNSAAYNPWTGFLYKGAYKVLGGDPKTSGSTNWFNKFRNAEFTIGASRNDTPFVLGKFIEAARQLRALGAEVTNAPDPKPNAYRMVKFNVPGQFDKQGKPVTGTVKAKPNETMFYLFDYLRLWNQMDPPSPAETEPTAASSTMNDPERESNPYHLHLSREENPARERVAGGRELIGEKVTVYRNLHLDTFSVRLGTKVVLHSDYVKLRNAKFVVQAGGRDTVRRTGAKLVHAYIGGILEDFAEEGEAPAAPTLPHPVGYNPYKDDTFVARDTGEAAFTASEVELLGTRAYAKGLNGRVENPARSGVSGLGLLTGAVLGAFVMHRVAKR